MKSKVTVLLLVAFLLGESFAGYSTGFRRTPKPETPGTVVRPVVYPSFHTRGQVHWKEPGRGSVETGKVDEGGPGKIGDGEIDKIDDTRNIEVDKEQIDQEEKILEDDAKVIGSQDVLPTEEKNIPYDLAEIPEKDDSPVKLDEEFVNEEEQPYIPDGIPPEDSSIYVEEKQQPNIPDEEYGGGDVPEKISQPLPDEPLIEDTLIDVIPGEAVDDRPNDEIQPEIEPDGEGDIAIGPLPYPDVPPRDIVVIPPGTKEEILEPYPIKVGGENANINLYELMEKLELSRFLHLVEEADLQDLLTGEGPFTIFAPSDFALSKLDADTIRKLATNQELLRQFVLYHCVDGRIYGPLFEERENTAVVTKFDRSIHVNKYGEVWCINGIPISIRDQTCRNGVIHILDNSLYPYPTGDLFDTLEKLENFQIYTELIRNAKLDKELKGEVIYTIFAPTDVAFSKLPPANLEWLKWDIPAIKRMFGQLTVSGTYYTTWIPNGSGQLSSIDEKTLSFTGYPDDIKVNGVGLSQYDITASNGCIHAIDDIWFLSELGTPSSGSSQKKKHSD